MRRLSLGSVLLACASCVVAARRPPIAVGLQLSAAIHADAMAPPPPPPPAPPGALAGAPVAEFFGIPLDGADDIVFVLDCSGSMDEAAQGTIAAIAPPPDPAVPTTTPPPPDQPPPPPPDRPPPSGAPAPPPAPRVTRKIDVARAELIDALERLPAGTHLAVIFFNSDLEAFAPTMIALEDASRAGLLTFVRATDATGRTALAPAMRTAFLMNARRVVLLSDGLGNVGGDSRDVLRDAREAIAGRVRIDTIGLGRDQDGALLQALARDSGGLYQAF